MASHRRVYVAGHRGMVGSAIVRQLRSEKGVSLITRTHEELDLLDQAAVRGFFADERPDEVYLAAARVGGIHANDTYPAEFIYQNLMIETNVVHEAWRHQVKSLLFLGSSCIYPRLASQPIKEAELLQGPLEPTNEPYAIAKIAGIKLCESYHRQYGCDFRSVMPTNLYGPNDNFHLQNSHVIPALIRKFHEARVAGADSVQVWGTGKAMREFLHVDDMARACVHVMSLPGEQLWSTVDSRLSHINVGTGEDVTIKRLAEIVRDVVGFDGEIRFDTSKPDGTPRKLLDVMTLRSLGWAPTIGLEQGLDQTYRWYLENERRFRR